MEGYCYSLSMVTDDNMQPDMNLKKIVAIYVYRRMRSAVDAIGARCKLTESRATYDTVLTVGSAIDTYNI